jgi:uncharacterized protein (DUF1015 family)
MRREGVNAAPLMKISAFDPLRPAQDKAKQVASLPYDVVSTEEARRLAKGNPDSFLHVERSEIDLPPNTDPYAPVVYEKAVSNLKDMVSRGSLIRHGHQSLFVYRQKMGAHVQEGIVCCCHVDDYDGDRIKKHEKTRQDKEDDRSRHALALRTHASPVFLAYRDDAHLDAMVREIVAREPLYDFASEDYVQHTIWEAPDPKKLQRALSVVPLAYVADGHHRCASASRAAAACRAENPGHTGEEEYNWFLATMFPASRLQILPYNRLVADLNGHSVEQFLDRVSESFNLLDGIDPSPRERGHFAMYLDGGWRGLIVKNPPDSTHPIDSLDVSILQDRLLAPILGIADPRSSKRIDFVGGIRGTDALKKAVDAGEAAVAFSLYPTTMDQLLAIADAGEIMPPKSTWFEPKLRSGLLIHSF